MKEIPRIYESTYSKIINQLNSTIFPNDYDFHWIQIAVQTVDKNRSRYLIIEDSNLNSCFKNYVDFCFVCFELVKIDYYTKKRTWKLATEVTIVPDECDYYHY